MPHYGVSGFALATRDFEVDEELDLLADEEEEVCPACGTALTELLESDMLTLHCPLCDRLYH